MPVKTKMRIDLADFAGYSKFVCYDYFHVGTPNTNYRLTIGGYQKWGIGAAGDSMTWGSNSTSLNGMPLSTHVQDNDKFISNCASSWQSALWYNSCTHSNLNGLYLDGQSNSDGVTWKDFNATAPLHQVGSHFAIQIWSWEGVAEDLPQCHHGNQCSYSRTPICTPQQSTILVLQQIH